MIDLLSLLEFLAYAGSAVVIALVIRELARPDGAMSLAALLAMYPEPPAHGIREDEPVRWNVERLPVRRVRARAAARSPEPVAGGARRPVMPERPMTACEGS